MNKYTADYDRAAVTPSAGTGAVGRVGGSDDDSFSREDGAEARGTAAQPAESSGVERGGGPAPRSETTGGLEGTDVTPGREQPGAGQPGAAHGSVNVEEPGPDDGSW